MWPKAIGQPAVKVHKSSFGCRRQRVRKFMPQDSRWLEKWVRNDGGRAPVITHPFLHACVHISGSPLCVRACPLRPAVNWVSGAKRASHVQVTPWKPTLTICRSQPARSEGAKQSFASARHLVRVKKDGAVLARTGEGRNLAKDCGWSHSLKRLQTLRF